MFNSKNNYKKIKNFYKELKFLKKQLQKDYLGNKKKTRISKKKYGQLGSK